MSLSATNTSRCGIAEQPLPPTMTKLSTLRDNQKGNSFSIHNIGAGHSWARRAATTAEHNLINKPGPQQADLRHLIHRALASSEELSYDVTGRQSYVPVVAHLENSHVNPRPGCLGSPNISPYDGTDHPHSTQSTIRDGLPSTYDGTSHARDGVNLLSPAKQQTPHAGTKHRYQASIDSYEPVSEQLQDSDHVYIHVDPRPKSGPMKFRADEYQPAEDSYESKSHQAGITGRYEDDSSLHDSLYDSQPGHPCAVRGNVVEEGQLLSQCKNASHSTSAASAFYAVMTDTGSTYPHDYNQTAYPLPLPYNTSPISSMAGYYSTTTPSKPHYNNTNTDTWNMK